MIPNRQPKDIQIKKPYINPCLHWSSVVATDGGLVSFALVGLGQIDYGSNKSERTFDHGKAL